MTDRSTRARNAALARWSKSDAAAGTAPARAAFLAKFDDEVDEARELDPEERERRAHRARRVHMSRLASKRWESKKNGNGNVEKAGPSTGPASPVTAAHQIPADERTAAE